MNADQQLALQQETHRAVETRLRAHKEADEKCITDLRQALAKAAGTAPTAPVAEVTP